MDKVQQWDFTQGFEAAHAAGFSDHELLELRMRWSTERDYELRRRVSHVPRIMRERIHWDAAIENLIPFRPGNIAPCLGYMVLPIRAEMEVEEFNVLVFPPAPQRAVEILWPWGSEFLSWLTAPKAERGLTWLKMMIEEFGLPEEGQHAWASPHAGASVLNIKRHAAFWRELQAARLVESKKRIAAMADWLADRGLDGSVSYTPHAVIRGSEDDYAPETSTYIFSVSVRKDDYCLVCPPAPREPMHLQELFKEARKFVASSNWVDQQIWLNSLQSNN